MRRNVGQKTIAVTAGLLCIVAAGTQMGCSGQSTPQVATPPPAAQAPAPAPAVDTRTADLAAREQALSQREADLAAQDRAREVAKQQTRDMARDQREAATQAAAAKKARIERATASRRAEAEDRRDLVRPAAAPAPISLRVPAGTQLTVALTSDLSSKTARPGDPFEARLVSDLMINDRRAVNGGARVTGTITDVISGSNAIGGTPMLGLRFDHLQLNDGEQMAISGELRQEGNSEKGQDTAKILGGAAAGAVLGHQVKHGSGGQIIGGLLGGAIGAVAAKKTGTEILLASGSTLTIALGQGFTVTNP